MTAAPLTVDDVLFGAHTTYTPAKLGAVTTAHPKTAVGGLSVIVDACEWKFLLPADDLRTLQSLLGDALAAHDGANLSVQGRDQLPLIPIPAVPYAPLGREHGGFDAAGRPSPAAATSNILARAA